MSNIHQPVLLAEVLHYLQPQPGQHFIDCTLGGGGHAMALLERTAPDGRLLGVDLDPLAIDLTTAATQQYKRRITLVRDNFKNLITIANVSGIDQFAGVLLDLGLSSNQLQDRARGFSFLAESPLDMRFGGQHELTAETILNRYRLEQLIELFQNFGQEPLAVPIAKSIIATRQTRPIVSAQQLTEIIVSAYRKHYHRPSRINPATRVFQALRIAVNDELNNLRVVLPAALAVLAPGGRLAVISYHSLEDTIVKNFFKTESKDCICPPTFPACQCNHHRTIQRITKKPVVPGPEEVARNPRSRSAKLRVAQKI